MARVSIADDCAHAVRIGKSKPAVVPPIKRAALRRVIAFILNYKINLRS
jgi:hypothetical protein